MGQAFIVSDQDQRRAAFLVQIEQQVADALAGVAVEVAGRLVGEQHVRLGGEGAGDGYPLLFATGELARRMVQALPEPDALEQFGRSLAGIPAAIQLQGQHHVLQGIEAVEQLERLEDEAHMLGADSGALVFVQCAQAATGQGDLTAAGQVETGQQAEQGGFSGAGTADDGQAVAFVQFQAEFVQDGQFTFRAGNHFAKVPRSENACAHGESDACVVFECWPGLDVHGPERSGGYSPDRWR